MMAVSNIHNEFCDSGLKNRDAQDKNNCVPLVETNTFSSPTKNQLTPGKKGKRRRCRRRRSAPYSAKHFLGRPKINAPANTTQFLCDDKEDLRTEMLFDTKYSSGTENRSTTDASSDDGQDSMPDYSTKNYDNQFMTDEFDKMYDEIKMEILSKESIPNLSQRCLELESGIHNLKYLLQKERERRMTFEKVLYLRHRNAELQYENEQILHQQSEDCSNSNNPVVDSTNVYAHIVGLCSHEI